MLEKNENKKISAYEDDHSRNIIKGLRFLIRWGVWIIPSLTLYYAFYYSQNGLIKESTIYIVLTVIFFIISSVIQFILEVILEVIEWTIIRLEEVRKPLVNWLTRKIEKILVNTWHEYSSSFRNKYLKSLEYSCRDFQVQGLEKNRILKLQKVFVSLKVMSKDFKNISSSLIQTGLEDSDKQKEIGEILTAMRIEPAFRRLAILGSPGSGKTTLLRYLTLMYATGNINKLGTDVINVIPILLSVKDIYGYIIQEQTIELATIVSNYVKKIQTIEPLEPPAGWFEKKLYKNQCLVMLDGLDEVADELERQKVSTWIDRQMQNYPETPFILTSRPFGYKNAQLEQEIFILEVQPFTLVQMQQFIQNWYLQTEVMSRVGEYDLGVQEEAKRQADDLIKRIKDNLPLLSMAVNPLLLTMIATVHYRGSALPGKRIELYKEVCQVMLGRRQLAKRIDDSISADQKQKILQKIALWLMEKNTREFDYKNINNLIQKDLNKITRKQCNTKDFLKKVSDISGLLLAKKEEETYEFCHLSFQEYLASVEIIRTQKEDLLIEKIKSNKQLSWWSETIRLYCAQCDSTELVLAALENANVDTLELAYDCLEEGFSIEPDVRHDFLKKINEDLESHDLESSKLAAQVILSRRLKHVTED